MTRRIFWWIFSSMVLLLFLCIIGLVSILFYSFEDTQLQELEGQASLVAHLLDQNDLSKLKNVDLGNVRLDVIDADGTVVFDSSSESQGLDNHLNRPEIEAAASQGAGTAIRHSDTLGTQSEYAAVQLQDGGFVRVSVIHSSAIGMLAKSSFPLMLLLGMALVVSVLLARGLAKVIVSPINEIDLDHPMSNQTYEQLMPLMERLQENKDQIEEQMKELNRKKEEFDTVSSNMDEGLILLGPEEELVSANPAARRIFDIGKDWEVSDNPKLSKALSQSKELDRARYEMKKDGKRYTIEAASIVSGTRISGAVILAMDITEKQEAQKRRREFASNVTHEMKTPLQTILSSTELLESGMVRQEDVPRFLGYIHKEADHLSALVGSILHLSRLEHHESEDFRTISIQQEAQSAVQSLQTYAAMNHVELYPALRPAWISGAPGVIEEIVHNLVENSIRYSQATGKVWIRCGTCLEYGKRKVFVEVKDDGIGIPIEEQERIFERFYRVEKSHSRALGGSGLGLAIVKHSVELLQGKIHLESKEKKGTTIRIEFPYVVPEINTDQVSKSTDNSATESESA